MRQFTLIALTAALLSSCAGVPPFTPVQRYNEAIAYTTGLDACAAEECAQARLRFVEYSDHGNLFDGSDAQAQEVFADIASNKDVNVVVYVHGWHHDARRFDPDAKGRRKDKDLAQFGQRVRQLSTLEGFRHKQTLGVYVGWRGESTRLKGLRIPTYYARKRTAEEVGRTGLRRFLLRIEEFVRGIEGARLIVIGHSMGTNAIISAIGPDLIHRALDAGNCDDDPACVRDSRFGHGVFLFNPAIEANAFTAMRAGIVGKRYTAAQPKLLHVIASRDELLARAAFSVGQRVFGTWWSNEIDDAKLPYRWNGGNVQWASFREVDLMTITMGQFAPFWTGSIMTWRGDAGDEWSFQHIKGDCHALVLPANTDFDEVGVTDLGDAQQASADCRRGSNLPRDWVQYPIAKHIDARLNDPIQMTVSDWQLDSEVGGYQPSSARFMKDHNAHLCPYPMAYIAAGVLENEMAVQGGDVEGIPAACKRGNRHRYTQCFAHYREQFAFEPGTWDAQRCETR